MTDAYENVLEPRGKCPACLMSLAEYADNGITWVDDVAYHNGCEPGGYGPPDVVDGD